MTGMGMFRAQVLTTVVWWGRSGPLVLSYRCSAVKANGEFSTTDADWYRHDLTPQPATPDP